MMNAFKNILVGLKNKNNLVLFLLCLMICGCARTDQQETVLPPPPPKPEISFESTETTQNGVKITISYLNHSYQNYGISYTELNSEEDLLQYKAKVEFLLSRLEEAQKRMTISEKVNKQDN